MGADIRKFPLHLGLGATAMGEPEFTGLDWYAEYAKRHEKDGKEGRLVSAFTFQSSWDVWEMHPNGSEVVICLEGEVTLIQDAGEEQIEIRLKPLESAINPPGIWHTADVTGEATLLFITAGLGTRHRPR